MKTIPPLSKALARTQHKRREIEQLATLKTELEARELSLLASFDLQDEKAFVEVANVRIKLEIVPRKQAVLETQLGAEFALLTAAIAAAFPEFNAALHAKCEELRTSLARHLKPIYPTGTDLDRPVLAAWRENEIAHKLDGLGMSHEFSTDKAQEAPEATAAKMLERVAALEALTIPEKL